MRGGESGGGCSSRWCAACTHQRVDEDEEGDDPRDFPLQVRPPSRELQRHYPRVECGLARAPQHGCPVVERGETAGGP